MMRVIYKMDAITGESIEGCILKILAYFSFFDFPLSKVEIKSFLTPEADKNCVDNALIRLVENGTLFRIDDFYLLQNSEAQVRKKHEGYARAGQLLPKAMKIGHFLCKFPYVRGNSISGGLSKMYAHE